MIGPIKFTQQLTEKVWENFNNFYRPHGSLHGKTPYWRTNSVTNRIYSINLGTAVVRKIFSLGGFARNVLIMATGTAIAQAISVAVAPILTRLYTPADYGIFALYTSFCTLISVLSTGRYDIAAMLPEDDKDAINLLGLSTAITISVSLISFIVIITWNQDIGKFLGNEKVTPWLYLIPLSVMLSGFYQIMYTWTNRAKQFKGLTFGKVSGSLSGASTSLGLGYLGARVGGLIAGMMVNQIAATGILSWQLWKKDRNILSPVSKKSMIGLGIRFYKFPLLSLPADYINTTAQQIPTILLTRLFGSDVVGFYALTLRVLSLPLGLISSSILDVFRQRASDDYRKRGNCKEIYIKTLFSLLFFSIVPFVIFFFTAPTIFAFVFGETWRPAGEYAQIMTPLFFFRFTASPLSYVLYIAEKQKYDLIWQICLLIFSVISITLGGYYKSPYLAILYFSGSYSLLYIVYILISYHFSKGLNR